MSVQTIRIMIHAGNLQHLGDSHWDGVDLFCNTWRLYYNLAKGGSVIFNREKTEFQTDKIYLLPPGMIFSTMKTGSPKQFYLHFTTGSPYNHVRRQVYSIDLSSEMRDMIHSIIPELLSPPIFLSPLGILKAINLCSYSLSLLPESIIDTNTDNRISSALTQLEKNPEMNFNIKDLAKRHGLCYHAFIRLFKAQIGLTPYQYLMRLRIEKSRAMLVNTKMSIDEIAEMTGFNNRFHFSNYFKQQTGIPPAQFRISG